MKDIYINSNLNPHTKFASSSRSTEFKDILPWNIYQMITKTIPISTRKKQYDETVHPVVNMMESQWKLRQFPNGRKAIVKQILASEERNSKEQGCENCSLGVIITEFTRSISSIRIGKPVFMMDVKISKDKNIGRWVDRESLIYVRQNRIKNCSQRQRRWSIQEKK